MVSYLMIYVLGMISVACLDPLLPAASRSQTSCSISRSLLSIEFKPDAYSLVRPERTRGSDSLFLLIIRCISVRFHLRSGQIQVHETNFLVALVKHSNNPISADNTPAERGYQRCCRTEYVTISLSK